ncbi:hypothetical protein Ddc_08217 [Ditylenchus destructor]|nr:hypothetical protein Ddc_08217 [Ditylenchus destructor]
MHETGGSGYKRLSRSSLGGVPVTRNVASFVFLISLVIFVSLFYLYISTSSELQELRQDYTGQGDYATKLKNELLELNMKVETAQNAENDCKSTKTALDSKYQECLSDLGRQKSAVADMEGSTRDKDTTISNLRAQLEDSKKLVSTLEANISSLQAHAQSVQDTSSLTNAITMLKNEIAQKDATIAQLKTNDATNLQVNDANGTSMANNTETIVQQILQRQNEISSVNQSNVHIPQIEPNRLSADLGNGGPAPPGAANSQQHNGLASGSQAKAVGVAPPMMKVVNATTTRAPRLDAHDEQESNVLGEGGVLQPAAEDSVKAGEVNSVEVNGGEPAAGAQAAANNQNEAELSNEIRSGQGEFLAERQPGARVKLEENRQAKEDHPEGGKAGDSPLLKAAAGEDNQDDGPPGESAPNGGDPDDTNNNNDAANNDADDDSNKLH